MTRGKSKFEIAEGVPPVRKTYTDRKELREAVKSLQRGSYILVDCAGTEDTIRREQHRVTLIVNQWKWKGYITSDIISYVHPDDRRFRVIAYIDDIPHTGGGKTSFKIVRETPPPRDPEQTEDRQQEQPPAHHEPVTHRDARAPRMDL